MVGSASSSDAEDGVSGRTQLIDIIGDFVDGKGLLPGQQPFGYRGGGSETLRIGVWLEDVTRPLG